jgi:hypothetical protein
MTLRPRRGHGPSTTPAVANPPSTRPPTAAIETTRHGEQSLDVHDHELVHEVLTPKDTKNTKTRSDPASTPASATTDRSCNCGTIAECYTQVIFASIASIASIAGEALGIAAQ